MNLKMITKEVIINLNVFVNIAIIKKNGFYLYIILEP